MQVNTVAEELHPRPIREIAAAEILHLLKRIKHNSRREMAIPGDQETEWALGPAFPSGPKWRGAGPAEGRFAAEPSAAL